MGDGILVAAVVGSRGRSQLAGALPGSAACPTIHLAGCPVLVVP